MERNWLAFTRVPCIVRLCVHTNHTEIIGEKNNGKLRSEIERIKSCVVDVTVKE